MKLIFKLFECNDSLVIEPWTLARWCDGLTTTVTGNFAVRNFAVGNFAVKNFAVRKFRRKDISPYESSPYGYFAVRKFCRKNQFAVWKFRRMEILSYV